MNDRKSYLRNPIDFRPARGHIDSDLIYTVLMLHNGTRHTSHSASGLIVKAYKNYDPSIPIEITRMKDIFVRADSFVKKYGIETEDDIMDAIKNRDLEMDVSLLEPGEKHFSFNMEDPDVKDMWNILNGIRYRNRGIMVNEFLYQYMANGNVEIYNDLCAERLLAWMKEEYAAMADIDTSRLQETINMIMILSGAGERHKKQINDDEFRKLIGAI